MLQRGGREKIKKKKSRNQKILVITLSIFLMRSFFLSDLSLSLSLIETGSRREKEGGKPIELSQSVSKYLYVYVHSSVV